MKTIISALAMVCLLTGFAFGQDQMLSQASLQLGGLVNTSATGSSVTDAVTGSLGMRASFSYLFSKRLAVEASYGYSRNTQNYTSNGLALSGVQTNVNTYTAALLYQIPIHLAKLRPYALAGTGAIQFRPTGNTNNPAGSAPENRGVFMYGAGADWNLTPHIGLRGEYRGFLYTAPDFALTNLTVSAWTHLAEPSVGAFYRF